MADPLERSDPSTDSIVEDITPRLRARFGRRWPLSEAEIEREVRDSAQHFSDVPVHSFVSILTERRARRRLEERIELARAG